jgi:septum site-determining protein MinC
VPLEVRGRFLTAVVLKVPGPPDAAFLEALDAVVAKSPQFFADAPLVLDLAEARGIEGADGVGALVDALRARRLFPVGVQSAPPRLAAVATGMGLVALQPGRDAPPSARAAGPEPEPGREERRREEPAAAVVVTEPVRSGQRVVAPRGDLVVVASVASGAELVARGNVHVYGPLRGRVLAGVEGDRTARIFCQSLEAELIAIAGLYQTSEDFRPAVVKTRVQAFLEEKTLRIEPLK